MSDLVLQSPSSPVTPAADGLRPPAPGFYLPVWRLVALSVLLWGVGVGMIRQTSPLGLFAAGPASWALLAATLPLVWLCLRVCRRVAGGPDADIVQVAALASAPALLLDGLAMSLAPWLYGPIEAGRRAGAGWVLWFVGATLALAFLQAGWQTRSLIAHQAPGE